MLMVGAQFASCEQEEVTKTIFDPDTERAG